MSFPPLANTFCHRSTRLSGHTERRRICTHPAPRSTALWQHAKFDFKFSIRASKGPWGETVPFHSAERERLEVISSSHCIQSLTSLCSLIHFVVYQEERSIKAFGRWHVGESDANTLSLWERLQPTVKCNIIENAFVWCLTEYKRKTMMKLTSVSHYAWIYANLTAKMYFICGH